VTEEARELRPVSDRISRWGRELRVSGVGAGAPCGWTRPSERDGCGARELRASGMDTGASSDASKSVCINSVGR
jgi:hypothetical protein